MQDRLECWLLDAQTRRPLVLLDSLLPDETIPLAEVPRWRVSSGCIRRP
ncbi:MAG: hypothetical protein PVJ03_00130 [Chromatiaceae bacterium]